MWGKQVFFKFNFAIFWPKSRFQTLLSHFFRTSDTCFSNLTLINLNNFFLHFLFVIKKLNFCGVGTHLKKIIIISHSLLKSRFPTLVFHIFRSSGTCFLFRTRTIWKKLFFCAPFGCMQNKNLPLVTRECNLLF